MSPREFIIVAGHPRVYLADSGLLHALLNQSTRRDLDAHPKLGASWEGFLMDQVCRRIGALPQECFFWATHAGADLDLLVVRGRRRFGFEIKRTVAPRLTASMRVALADLGLDRIDVLHAGEKTFPLADRVRAVAAARIIRDISPLAET